MRVAAAESPMTMAKTGSPILDMRYVDEGIFKCEKRFETGSGENGGGLFFDFPGRYISDSFSRLDVSFWSHDLPPSIKDNA